MRAIKRFFCFIALLCLAAVMLVSILAARSAPAFKGGESYAFYLGDTSKNCREVRCENRFAALARAVLPGINGESATYETLDLEKFLESVGGEVLFSESFSDGINYYCSANLPYSVTLYGKRVNLHVCVKEDGVKVGTPIIFGGY